MDLIQWGILNCCYPSTFYARLFRTPIFGFGPIISAGRSMYTRVLSIRLNQRKSTFILNLSFSHDSLDCCLGRCAVGLWQNSWTENTSLWNNTGQSLYDPSSCGRKDCVWFLFRAVLEDGHGTNHAHICCWATAFLSLQSFCVSLTQPHKLGVRTQS